MKTVQTQINPESTHHSLINHENQTFFQQASSNESPLFFSPAIIQPKLKIGDPDDKYERQADRVADAVVSSPAPDIQQQLWEEEEEVMMKEQVVQRKCEACEKEESVRRKPLTDGSKEPNSGRLTPSIQCKLIGQPNYHPYLLDFLPGRNPARDPASRLTPDERINHVETLLQNLCPDFQINGSTGEVTPNDTTRTPDQYAGSGNPVGCCCLHIFTRPASTNNWRILVSDVVSPHTNESDHVVVVPGLDAPISYGNWTGGPAERRVLISNEIILGHELCGHAALQELQAHPPHQSRLTTNVHDPTVNIQNLIASEQGEPASDLRGLAGTGSHRGESFARLVISGYPINTISPYSIPDSSQHQKLALATRLVQANDFFVDIIGHTDPSGDDAVNNRVSLQRANVVKSFIAGRVRNTRHLDRFDPTTPRVNRFRSVTGVRDLQPPQAAVQGNPNNWRRVEIFLASFPASSENPPSATPSTVTPVAPPSQALILSLFGDECEQKLVKGAYPGISVPSPVPAISPKREAGVQRKCTECKMEEKEYLQLMPLAGSIPSFVQRRETGEEVVNEQMVSSLGSSKGGGRPLPNTTQNWMESRFGADFSGVKVHTDSRAVQLSRDLNAQAFTNGSDIYFNRGKYAPGTSEGKRLLAHELTHVVQQKGENIPKIQKQNMPENAVVPPATSAEKREWVNTLIEFLEMSREFWEHAVIDQAQLDRVLDGWNTGISTAEGYILNDLNDDAALRQRLRQAYTAALRVFMTRAAVQLNKPGIRLYLEKMHRIPEWAWPGSGDFNLQNQADKRVFIQGTIDALNEAATFSGYQIIDNAGLTDILTRLKNLMDEQLRILVADLNNDATLRADLRTAYLFAIQTLFGRAAPQMGATVSQLAIRYLHLIPDGLDREVAGISMPIPIGLTPNAAGEVVFNLNGFEVAILPDGVKAGSGAETTFNIDIGQASWRGRRGRVTSVTPPRAVPRVTIQTRYAPGATGTGRSGYGRGTTAEDRAKGNTSLGFHEGRHGIDFLLFLRDNAPPTFAGAVGMSAGDMRTEMGRWQQAWRTYNTDMDTFSKQRTDCVGTTLDQFNAGRGQITHECP